MAAKRGIDCKLYRNTGSYGSPVWNEVTKVRDVTLTLGKGEAEAGARDSTWEQFLPLRKQAELTVNMVTDTAVDDFAVYQTSYSTDTVIDHAIADGAIATTGTRYFRADMYTLGFDDGQPLDGIQTNDLRLKLAYSVNTPLFVLVP